MADVVAMNKVNGLSDKEASALIRLGWSKEIVYEGIKFDIMSNIPSLTGLINPGKDKQFVSNKIIQDITPSGMDKFARTIIMERISALSGTGKFGIGVSDGVDTVLGNEENVRLKYFKVYANDWAHAVTGQNYGFNYRDQKETEIFDKVKGLLAQWYGELDGYFMRHAYTQGVSPNLEKDPINLDTYYNDNIYILNSEDTFLTSSDYDDYTAYETAVLAALGDVAAADDGKYTVTKLLRIASQAAEADIKPVNWNGLDLYVLYIHPEDFDDLIDPSVDGSFGKNWVAAASLGTGDLDKVVPGAEFVVAQTVVVARDRRAPRFQYVAAGTSGFKYLLPGRNDQRKGLATTGANVFNVGILVGESALVKFNPEPAHYEDQDENYKRYNNVGFFGACGYMTPTWQNDDETPTDDLSDRIQDSSMLVFSTARVFEPTT